MIPSPPFFVVEEDAGKPTVEHWPHGDMAD